MREKLRLAILDAYGIDIDKYDFDFKNSLSAYTINVGEYTIRVTLNDEIDKPTKIERLKWAKDLKQFKNTICEPVVSKNGELLEEIQIGKWSLTLSMYRTAKGRLINANDITPMFFISAGDMLGTMHLMSMQRDSSEKKYNIPTPYVMYEKKRKSTKKYISKEMNDRIDRIIQKSFVIEKNLENFGICYGEFDLHNIIVDTNNIHLFDFDKSIYAHYMYDVASFAVSVLSSGYQPKRDAKDVIENTFIPWFRIGYSINKRCDIHTFDNLETFMGLRGIWLLINLIENYNVDKNPFIKLQIDYIMEILMEENIYDGINRARKALFNSENLDKKISYM